MLDLQYPSSLQAITSLLPLPLTHRYSLNWNPAVLIHGRLNYFPCQAKKESLNSLSKSNKTLPATPALILVMIFNILTLTPLFDKGMTSYFVWVLQSLYVNTDTQYCDTKCCCHCTTTQHPRYTDEKYRVALTEKIHHFGCPLAVTPVLRWYPWSRPKHCSCGEETSDQAQKHGQKALSIQKRH